MNKEELIAKYKEVDKIRGELVIDIVEFPLRHSEPKKIFNAEMVAALPLNSIQKEKRTLKRKSAGKGEKASRNSIYEARLPNTLLVY